MKQHVLWTSVLAVGMLALGACGDDDDVGDAGKDSGPKTSDGNSGKSGSNDASMSGGSGGAASVSVECGTSTCTGSAMTAGFLDVCCVDRTTGTCGQALAGGSCMAPEESDPQCQPLNAFGALMFASCCTADGKCGLSGAALGVACTSLEDVAASPLGGLPISFPKPKACQAADGGTVTDKPDAGDDAGTEDAG